MTIWSGCKHIGSLLSTSSLAILSKLNFLSLTQPPTMNELKDNALKRPMDPAQMGSDVGALNALLGLVNNPNITGAEVPKETKSQPAPRPVAPIATPAIPVPPPRAITGNRFAFTGRLKVGKDYVASALAAKIFGFADPLYFLQDYFFGTSAATNPSQKDIPGARQFLQTVGQWGWGAVNEKYPLTPARACFVKMIRSLATVNNEFPEHLHVDWANFGRSKSLWVDAALNRIERYLEQFPDHRVAIVNARFEHEFVPLKNAGFEHYHVMCSNDTWAKRLGASKLTPQSPAVIDMSEKLAHALDADVIKKISANKTGPMLRAIWNDEKVPSPSPRIYTLAQFLQQAAIDSTPAVPGYAEVE